MDTLTRIAAGRPRRFRMDYGALRRLAMEKQFGGVKEIGGDRPEHFARTLMPGGQWTIDHVEAVLRLSLEAAGSSDAEAEAREIVEGERLANARALALEVLTSAFLDPGAEDGSGNHWAGAAAQTVLAGRMPRDASARGSTPA